MDLFAALRFTEDENLAGRVYWYIAPFHVKEGERALAPVGPHDRLQCARVERIKTCAEEDAPYPPALCKRIAAKYGEREVKEGVYDLGGVRYDARHFVRMGRIFIAADREHAEGVSAEKIDTGCENWLRRAAEERGCAVLFGENVKEGAALILRIVRGEDPAEVPPSVLIALRDKLC